MNLRKCFAAVCLLFLATSLRSASAQGQAVPAGPPAPAMQNQGNVPPWIPITPQHQEYLDKVLNYWEFRSAKIKTFSCKFTQWDFNQFSPDAQTPWTISTGIIKYAQPDKGLYQVDEVRRYAAPMQQGQKPDFPVVPDGQEKWVCDGHSIFVFDYINKQLVEEELPPEMQGQAISDGPLPFLFGAKAADLKLRYWMRVITPPSSQGEYWIEAIPKSRQDAANFQRIELILDAKDYLPKAMQMILPGGRDRKVFEFKDRSENDVLNNLLIFNASFWKPQLPSGWKKVVNPAAHAPVAQRQVIQVPGPQPLGPSSQR